jgi:DnaK suppressor protein
MDQDRARSLLIAERDEVQGLLKDAEAAGREDRQAEVDSEAEDEADAALALTEEGQDDAIAESLRSGQPIPDERLEADPAAELTVEEARAAERG